MGRFVAGVRGGDTGEGVGGAGDSGGGRGAGPAAEVWAGGGGGSERLPGNRMVCVCATAHDRGLCGPRLRSSRVSVVPAHTRRAGICRGSVSRGGGDLGRRTALGG